MSRVFVGFDQREVPAYEVAVDSLLRRSTMQLEVSALALPQLYEQRLLWRPIERSIDGKMIDHLSGAPQSTEFASSRFLVPFLQREGWALFVDCDVVFLDDVRKLFELADPRYALMCVQHDYTPASSTKMDGCIQTNYKRKNWSSVMLWNCSHPSHFRLSLGMVNQWPGELLHRFAWLRDSEIGALPAGWNWLVGEQQPPEVVHLAHFTQGGPWLPGWQGAEHDGVWHAERQATSRNAAAG